MTRTGMLTVAMAVAVALPLGAAFAQSPNSSGKCGPVTWSTDRMIHTGAPCAGDPAAGRARTSLSEPDVRSPMQEQAAVPNMAPPAEYCSSPDAAMMKDEFGRTYNCRGDRVR